MPRTDNRGEYIMVKKETDYQPSRLSELSYFTQQFIPLDTVFYHPTINGVEEVVYKEFLKTDLPQMSELYFSKSKAEKRAEKIKNNELDEDDK